MKNTNKLVRISLLLAIAFVVNYLESLVPLPIPLPGVKIGLANCIGLMVLYCFNSKDFIYFNILKVIMIALLRTGFGTAFFISTVGTLLSTWIINSRCLISLIRTSVNGYGFI